MGPYMNIQNTIQTNTSIQTQTSRTQYRPTHHTTPIEAVLSLYKCLVVYGGLWGAINTNRCMQQRVPTSARPTTCRGILVFIAPHSPPYTTKRLHKRIRACLDVIGCVWMLVAAYAELYMSRSDHI